MKFVLRHKINGYITKGSRDVGKSIFRAFATRFDTLEEAEKYANRYHKSDIEWIEYEQVER